MRVNNFNETKNGNLSRRFSSIKVLCMYVCMYMCVCIYVKYSMHRSLVLLTADNESIAALSERLDEQNGGEDSPRRIAAHRNSPK